MLFRILLVSLLLLHTYASWFPRVRCDVEQETERRPPSISSSVRITKTITKEYRNFCYFGLLTITLIISLLCVVFKRNPNALLGLLDRVIEANCFVKQSRQPECEYSTTSGDEIYDTTFSLNSPTEDITEDDDTGEGDITDLEGLTPRTNWTEESLQSGESSETTAEKHYVITDEYMLSLKNYLDATEDNGLTEMLPSTNASNLLIPNEIMPTLNSSIITEEVPQLEKSCDRGKSQVAVSKNEPVIKDMSSVSSDETNFPAAIPKDEPGHEEIEASSRIVMEKTKPIQQTIQMNPSTRKVKNPTTESPAKKQVKIDSLSFVIKPSVSTPETLRCECLSMVEKMKKEADDLRKKIATAEKAKRDAHRSSQNLQKLVDALKYEVKTAKTENERLAKLLDAAAQEKKDTVKRVTRKWRERLNNVEEKMRIEVEKAAKEGDSKNRSCVVFDREPKEDAKRTSYEDGVALEVKVTQNSGDLGSEKGMRLKNEEDEKVFYESYSEKSTPRDLKETENAIQETRFAFHDPQGDTTNTANCGSGEEAPVIFKEDPEIKDGLTGLIEYVDEMAIKLGKDEIRFVERRYDYKDSAVKSEEGEEHTQFKHEKNTVTKVSNIENAEEVTEAIDSHKYGNQGVLKGCSVGYNQNQIDPENAQNFTEPETFSKGDEWEDTENESSPKNEPFHQDLREMISEAVACISALGETGMLKNQEGALNEDFKTRPEKQLFRVETEGTQHHEGALEAKEGCENDGTDSEDYVSANMEPENPSLEENLACATAPSTSKETSIDDSSITSKEDCSATEINHKGGRFLRAKTSNSSNSHLVETSLPVKKRPRKKSPAKTASCSSTDTKKSQDVAKPNSISRSWDMKSSRSKPPLPPSSRVSETNTCRPKPSMMKPSRRITPKNDISDPALSRSENSYSSKVVRTMNSEEIGSEKSKDRIQRPKPSKSSLNTPTSSKKNLISKPTPDSDVNVVHDEDALKESENPVSGNILEHQMEEHREESMVDYQPATEATRTSTTYWTPSDEEIVTQIIDPAFNTQARGPLQTFADQSTEVTQKDECLVTCTLKETECIEAKGEAKEVTGEAILESMEELNLNRDGKRTEPSRSSETMHSPTMSDVEWDANALFNDFIKLSATFSVEEREEVEELIGHYFLPGGLLHNLSSAVSHPIDVLDNSMEESPTVSTANNDLAMGMTRTHPLADLLGAMENDTSETITSVQSLGKGFLTGKVNQCFVYDPEKLSEQNKTALRGFMAMVGKVKPLNLDKNY